VDPDDCQMAAFAFAERRAASEKEKPNLERSQCRSSRGGSAVTDNFYDKLLKR